MYWYVEGICMICLRSSVTVVRHINLYPVGSEGLLCCSDCENELLEFIRGKMRKAVKEKVKNFKKKEGDKPMTNLEKDLKELDDKMVKVVDGVSKKLFGKTRTEALNTRTCISCGESATEFKDSKSAAEWRITGLCQKCQDDFFFEIE